MVRRGYVSSISEAFELYLRRGAPAWVDRRRLALGRALKLLRASGALPVLAHPGIIRTDAAGLNHIVRDAAHAGLAGIECYYPLHDEETVARCLGLAEKYALPVVSVDAASRFLEALRGVTDPETKRKIIGGMFVEIFEEESKRLGGFDFLGQGTLYPDVIESTSVVGPSAAIKSHHNVGGLPDSMRMKVVEPLRALFKDEGRALGRQIGLDEEFVTRQPFPGPGLAVRIVGEVTPERLDVLRRADAIVVDEIKTRGWYGRLWQSFAVLLPVRSVGVMGDERTYDFTIAVRAVESQDGMTANWAPLPVEVLAAISSRIVNEVVGVNRVVYDISSKPPSTIEWE